jgi:hypothetical protein
MDNEKETTRTLAKKRGTWQASQDASESDETVNHYTMFLIGVAAFFAGFWALACLVNAFLQDGPINMLRQLAGAVTGM